MGKALDMARRSMAASEVHDREAWLALWAEDASIEDPVGPSLFDPEGKGHRGSEAVTAFYDNVISMSESLKFDMDRVVECGNEVVLAGRLTVTLPGGQSATFPIVNNYKVNDEGRLAGLRSFWESDKLTFGSIDAGSTGAMI